MGEKIENPVEHCTGGERHLSMRWLHKLFDLFLVISIVSALFLYRMQPYLSEEVRQRCNNLRIKRGV
jgi:hypothetical protein